MYSTRANATSFFDSLVIVDDVSYEFTHVEFGSILFCFRSILYQSCYDITSMAFIKFPIWIIEAL
jgi:hypothetical protein